VVRGSVSQLGCHEPVEGVGAQLDGMMGKNLKNYDYEINN